ncbi:MAG TPA: nucleotidyltransferase domain-containing protein [Nitrospirae bacterium]|nr:nucleotidyltransferase domain-containing protein [Nitrospirota bacterium]
MKRQVLDKIASVLRGYPEVAFAYLYGSFLVCPEEAKDIDVAVGLKGTNDLYRALQITGRIKDELQNQLPRPLDLRVLNLATVSFAIDVIERGLLFYEADEEFLTDFIESLSFKAIQTITNRYDLEGAFCRL